MTIAYLITAYNNPKHLYKLLEAINSEEADIFLHIDKKSNIKFKFPNINNLYVLNNNIKVYWGSYTFIEAVFLMIEKAFKVKNYDYFVLISGTDYPIRSNKHIINYFKKNKQKEFINLCKMPERDKTFDRLDYYFISTADRNNNFTNRLKRLINLLIRKLKIKRSYPKEYSNLTLYGGSNWWALSNECIKYIYKYAKKNPKYNNFYKNTLIPEEMYFHTIIGNSKFMKNVVNTITYTDWEPYGGPLPATITTKHMDILSKNVQPTDYGNKKMHALFARKFDDKNLKVIKLIDQKLR